MFVARRFYKLHMIETIFFEILVFTLSLVFPIDVANRGHQR
jgi:hypothetical protein